VFSFFNGYPVCVFLLAVGGYDFAFSYFQVFDFDFCYSLLVGFSLVFFAVDFKCNLFVFKFFPVFV
jgi:hypothetical protein